MGDISWLIKIYGYKPIVCQDIYGGTYGLTNKHPRVMRKISLEHRRSPARRRPSGGRQRQAEGWKWTRWMGAEPRGMRAVGPWGSQPMKF